MKNHVLALAAFLCLSTPALAEVYTCTPAGFTLTETAKGYLLKGTIETPTPGYSYKVDKNDDGHFVVTLTAPEGMALTVIDKVDIEYTIPKQDVEGDVTINIGKTFDWGDKAILCKEKL